MRRANAKESGRTDGAAGSNAGVDCFEAPVEKSKALSATIGTSKLIRRREENAARFINRQSAEIRTRLTSIMNLPSRLAIALDYGVGGDGWAATSWFGDCAPPKPIPGCARTWPV